MPPAVAEAAQVRRAVAAVGLQRRRHLADLLPCRHALTTISLANSMPGVVRLELLVGVLAEAAQAAVGVADRACGRRG